MNAVIEEDSVSLVDRIYRAEIISEGHFQLNGGSHSNKYFNKLKLFAIEELFSEVRRVIVSELIRKRIFTVVVPQGGAKTLGEKIIEDLIAAGFTKEAGYYDPVLIVAKKFGKTFRFEKEDLPKINKREVAVVDDVLTTGVTIKKLLRLLRRFATATCFCLVDRSGGVVSKEMGVTPVVTCLIEKWDPPCYLCKEDVPITPKPTG